MRRDASAFQNLPIDADARHRNINRATVRQSVKPPRADGAGSRAADDQPELIAPKAGGQQFSAASRVFVRQENRAPAKAARRAR